MPTSMVFALTLLAPLFVSSQPTESFSAKVIGITDGDTINVLRGLEDIRIRLEGIDCPEDGAEFSAKAKRFTADLLAGKVVEVRPKELDRYGRIVARVIVDGQDASLELLKAGLAWHYKEYSDDRELARAEQEARAKGIGIWSLPNPIPPWGQEETQRLIDSGAEVIYHGNSKSKVFHSPACRYYDCKNCTVEFRSREAVIKAGYRPGGSCKP